MYEPRRTASVPESPLSETRADAFRAVPRRAARSRAQLLTSRVAPTAVSVALLATAGAFAVNLTSSSQPTSAVPAPARADDTTSRDTVRTLADRQAADDAAETDESEAGAGAEQEGAEAYVGGEWASAFGAAAGEKFAQSGLVVRARASEDATQLGRLKAGDEVSVTDKVTDGYRQVAYDGKIGYVLNSKLGNEKPSSEPSASAAGGGGGEKYTGSTSYSGPTVLGLKPKAMVVYNAVTARWSFKSIGGYRASSLSNHQFGGAIDFMLTPGTDSAKGWAIANFVTANAAEFGIDHVIFEQKIWTPYKPIWRPMENRGSITANHYDHVHVSVKL
ncbi:MAG: SH3 domain-containing protein [Nigerium sp.]|nr:SH3 domain-containing protein [Nigerium sp.]